LQKEAIESSAGNNLFENRNFQEIFPPPSGNKKSFTNYYTW